MALSVIGAGRPVGATFYMLILIASPGCGDCIFSILLGGLKQRALRLSKRSDAKHVHWCFENVTVVDNSLMKGNNCRPVVGVYCDRRIVFIRFVGSHREYDKINAEQI